MTAACRGRLSWSAPARAMTPETAVNPGFPVSAAAQWQLREGKARQITAKTEAPIVGDGENEGRPERRCKRNSSVHGATPGAGWRIGGDVVGRNRRDGGFGAENESMVSVYGPRRRKSPRCPWKIGGAWGRREGRSIPPKSMPGVEGARFELRWSNSDGNGGSEGKANEPIQTDTRY